MDGKILTKVTTTVVNRFQLHKYRKSKVAVTTSKQIGILNPLQNQEASGFRISSSLAPRELARARYLGYNLAAKTWVLGKTPAM